MSSLVCLYFTLVAALAMVPSANAHMNLFLNQQEVMRLLGLSAELYYVRDGQVNEYALHFVVPVPANVKDIAFSWQSLADRPLPYSISILTSDAEVLPRPALNISAFGRIPKKVQTFAIALRCSGVRAAEVEVTIAIELMLNRASRNTTELVFRRKKICLLSDHSEPNTDSILLDDPLLLETVIAPPNGLIALFIGGCLAALLVAILIVVAFCARSRPTAKRNVHHSGQLMSTPSFHRLPTTATSCHQLSGPPSLVFPPAPTSTLPRSHDGTSVDQTDYYCNIGDPTICPPAALTSGQYHHHLPHVLDVDCTDEQLLQHRIQEMTVQRCRIRLSSLLQEGTFGRVYRGTYDDCQPVLVKTVEPNASPAQVSELLRDGMSLWGLQHTGIQSILGISLEDRIPPFLLFIAPPHARNLKLFLQEPAARALTTIQIVQMTTQLAQSLEYLHAQGLVHRDIAARNCVVDDTLQVRLTDCALARDLFPGDYCCLSDREYRPVKWSALEALSGKHFDEASDVWSFGVLMWELCTLARQPYQEIGDEDMEQFLRDGYRLAQPINCPDKLFAIMSYCWALSPLERPTFGQLHNCLEAFHAQITCYV